MDLGWHLLLVGGPSGVGKSRACAGLVRRLGVGTVEVDDIYTAVSSMTNPQQQPDLHYWATHPGVARSSAHHLLRVQLLVARALQPAVAAVLRCHLDDGPPAIVEGDYLLPTVLDELDAGSRSRVRTVFLHEDSRPQLSANLGERSGGAAEGRAQVSWLYGHWLRQAAQQRDLPVLDARPWDSTVDRILAAAG